MGQPRPLVETQGTTTPNIKTKTMIVTISGASWWSTWLIGVNAVEVSQQKQDVGPSTATRDHTPLSRPRTLDSLPDIQIPDSDGPLLITQRRGGGSEGGTKSNWFVFADFSKDKWKVRWTLREDGNFRFSQSVGFMFWSTWKSPIRFGADLEDSTWRGRFLEDN